MPAEDNPVWTEFRLESIDHLAHTLDYFESWGLVGINSEFSIRLSFVVT